jgi:hypothetical protein
MRILKLFALASVLVGCNGPDPLPVTEPADAGSDITPAIDTEITYCGDGYHRVNYAPAELVYCSPIDGVGCDNGSCGCGPGFTTMHIGADPTVLCVPPSPGAP